MGVPCLAPYRLEYGGRNNKRTGPAGPVRSEFLRVHFGAIGMAKLPMLCDLPWIRRAVHQRGNCRRT